MAREEGSSSCLAAVCGRLLLPFTRRPARQPLLPALLSMVCNVPVAADINLFRWPSVLLFCSGGPWCVPFLMVFVSWYGRLGAFLTPGLVARSLLVDARFFLLWLAGNGPFCGDYPPPRWCMPPVDSQANDAAKKRVKANAAALASMRLFLAVANVSWPWVHLIRVGRGFPLVRE